MTATKITRDRWGRPLIIPLGTDGRPDLEAKLIPYTRVSTLAKSLDDTSNLMTWKQRVTALGLVRRPDLMVQLAAVLANSDDPLEEAKKELNEIVSEAADAGGGSTAANTGTGLHGLTEALDLGRDVSLLAGEWADRLKEYSAKTEDLETVGVEVFIINDQVQASGTFDRLYYCPDHYARVGDLKTGKHDASYPLGVTVQIATYANGSLYDPETGERTPLHPDLDLSTGLLVHMPAKGEGTHVYELDLVKGWRAAQVAAEVHKIRKWKASDLRAEILVP